jgi:NitT/TauT family transport system permease protein
MKLSPLPLGKVLRPLLTLLGFLVAWQLVVSVFHVKEFIIPSPLATFAHLLDPRIAGKYHWLRNIAATLSEMLLSFLATAVAGVLVALLITWSRVLNRIITPIIALFNSLPKIALAPLFLLWFGYGIIPNIFIAIMIAFFPVVINAATGLNAVDPDFLDLVRYLHARKWQVFLKIRIPNSLPYIFSGLKISSTLCVVGAIVGEFIASDRGLGYLMKDSQALMDTPTMFAALILISVVGLSLFGVLSLLGRVLMPWQKPRVVA